MAIHGWDQNGFDYLIIDDQGQSRVAGRIFPMRPTSTTFRWYVFSDNALPAVSGAEISYHAAQQAVQQAIQHRAEKALSNKAS